MALRTEILAQYLAGEEVQFVFPNLNLEPSAIVEGECFRAPEKIKRILIQ